MASPESLTKSPSVSRAGVEVTFSPPTVKVLMAKTFRLPSLMAAQTSSTYSWVPSAQLSPRAEIMTAPLA